MLRHFTYTVTLLLVSLSSLTSCVDVDEFSNDKRGNFEALWTIMDERYCFFSEKKAELGVDWNEIRQEYSAQVNEKMSNTQLFEFLSSMLGTLRDGHVNLSSSSDYSRSWSWKEDYPKNFSDSLMRRYLGKSTEYKISCGMSYRILSDNIGYVYLGSFEDNLGEGNIGEVLDYLSPCNALIIDIRNNGGGQLTEAQKLAAHFTDTPLTAGYMRHKTGAAHDDFSDWQSVTIKPSAGIRWHKPVCILTNRSVYSAANEFVKYMKAIGNNNLQLGSPTLITIVGDSTGGGSGMPYSNELPNGWAIRMSACPMYDNQKQCTEFGISPDVSITLTQEDALQGFDSIIEKARAILNK